MRKGIKAAVEGAILALFFSVAAGFIWRASALVVGIRIGIAVAWAVATASVMWLIWARERSMESFWWAFGGGMALRGAALAALAVWGLQRTVPALESLLLSYGFMVLALLLTLEMRYLRLEQK